MTSRDERFARGVEQFNRHEFFECHESWEEIWVHAPEPDRTFLQGIIQIAAAFHHFTRANRSGARSLLREGLRKLEQFPEEYRNIRLEPVRRCVAWWIAALDSEESPGATSFPRMEWAIAPEGGASFFGDLDSP